jgi:hypothetical protein
MRRAILLALLISVTSVPALAQSPFPVVADVNPTRPGLHDYAPPTPVGRGYGNAYFGAGYMEFLFSGSGARTPHLPPRRVYVGPLESEPYGNRRVQLRQGMSPRAGTYMALPEHTVVVPLTPYRP